MKQVLALVIFVVIGLTSFGQSVQRSFDHNGTMRTYRIYVPPSYDGSKHVPLLFAFHGMGDNAANFQGIGFNQHANADTFITIYPQGMVDQLFGATAWNAGVGAFGIFVNGSVDDVGFITDLMDSLSNEFEIDSHRIYATGFSIGAFMTQRLACELSDKIAAIASVAGTRGNGVTSCNPSHPIPILHFHGTADSTITYQGEFALPGFGALPVGLSVDELITDWKDKNTCDNPEIEDSIANTKNDGYEIDRFTNPMCEGGSEVILYRVTDAPHTWLFTPSNDIDYTDTIWEFFQKHSFIEEVEDTTTTGVFSLADNDIEVYPNPVLNEVFVKTIVQADVIRVHDLLGQEIRRIIPNGLESKISLAAFQSGMYILSVDSRTEKSTYKILKQ